MILRVFAFIWGAILLTLLLFLLLINVADLGLPPDVQTKAEIKILDSLITEAYRGDGLAGVDALWPKIAPAFSGMRLVPEASCSAPGAIGTPAQGCIQLLQNGATEERLASLQPAAIPLLIGALASAIMAILLSNWLTRPIRDVSQGLKSIAAGHLDTRISARLQTTNRELQDLGQNFDLAAERLQALSDGRTQLFHDISHEIRSPLARLRAAVGLIELTPSRGAALAGRMEGDIARLDQLVNEILTLARLERGEERGGFRSIDLLDLVENIIADANFEGRGRGVAVSYSGADSLELRGNPELLHRACENVIRNALAHSPEGGVVRVAGRQSGALIFLEVSDDGPGVAEADLKSIFNPFVRGAGPRASQGSGLGLTIAASALQAHGGAILARNRQPRGLVIEISLPTRGEAVAAVR
jgi:two-component system, OmpR family, sensor kinase